MVSKQTSIINATGLHARPASVFVTEAKKYQCNVTIKNVDKDSAPVNAKSIMMILAAGLGTGTKVEVACDGADEQEDARHDDDGHDGDEAVANRLEVLVARDGVEEGLALLDQCNEPFHRSSVYVD